jgi:hypothetical protein
MEAEAESEEKMPPVAEDSSSEIEAMQDESASGSEEEANAKRSPAKVQMSSDNEMDMEESSEKQVEDQAEKDSEEEE